MPPDLPHPGERLAGYRIERQLGRGATGVVFLARQVALDRPVALKVVGAPWADDPAFRARFRHEARAAAALDHPNVVTVLDSGEDGDRLWLAMRLVDGPDLRVLLRRSGRLEPEHAVSIVEQVAAALDAAHAAGLVHRDVKPGNVLVEDAPGGALHAELADFGLVGGAAGGDPSDPDAIEGTPDYAAPEQLAGAVVTGAADVYALGRVLAEMLTGDPAAAVSPGATGFAGVVARATDPDPAWRYPTAGALARAARAVLTPEPTATATGERAAAPRGDAAGAAVTAGVAGALPTAAELDVPDPAPDPGDAEYEEVEPLVGAGARVRARRATTLVGRRRPRRRWVWSLPVLALLALLGAAALLFGELRDERLVRSSGERPRTTTTVTPAGSAAAHAGPEPSAGRGASSPSAGRSGGEARGAGGSVAPVVDGSGPGTAPTATTRPPAPGTVRFGGGSWALDLPSDAGWRQTAVQELSGGRRLLTRLRRGDGARIVVEHHPGQTAVFGPWPGASFPVRLPDAGRLDAWLFRGGRFAMCRDAVCGAVPVNGPSGGVLLVAVGGSDASARRALRRAARGLRVG